MHSVRIDRTKPLAAEPHLGHNRYHPEIAPVAEVAEGEEIALETRDALDGQITPGMAAADLATIEASATVATGGESSRMRSNDSRSEASRLSKRSEARRSAAFGGRGPLGITHKLADRKSVV